MYKVIVIEGKSIPMKSTGRTARLYAQYFKKDFISDFSNLGNLGKGQHVDTSLIENLAWVMAKTADDSIRDIDDWLDQFQSPLSLLEKSDEIFGIITNGFNTSVKSKKKHKKVHKK